MRAGKTWFAAFPYLLQRLLWQATDGEAGKGPATAAACKLARVDDESAVVELAGERCKARRHEKNVRRHRHAEAIALGREVGVE